MKYFILKSVLYCYFLTVFVACSKASWKTPGPRVRIEQFQKHLAKKEITLAIEMIDPADRPAEIEGVKKLLKMYEREEKDLMLVGSMDSPRAIKRIEVPSLSATVPTNGTSITLVLHYENKTKEAHLVWKDRWYIDLVR